MHIYFHMNPPQAGRTKVSKIVYWYSVYKVKSIGNQLLVPIHSFSKLYFIFFYLSDKIKTIIFKQKYSIDFLFCCQYLHFEDI